MTIGKQSTMGINGKKGRPLHEQVLLDKKCFSLSPTARQYNHVRNIAHENNLSKTEYIRRLINRDIEEGLH